MGVRIRLARFGRKKLPFYRLYVADSRCRRDGKHIEILGWYDPLSGAKDGVKRFSVKTERAKYWLSVGAQPTETAARILRKAEVLPNAPIASVAKEMGADLAAKTASSSQSQSNPVVKAVLATSRPMHNQVQMARSFVALPVLRCGCLW